MGAGDWHHRDVRRSVPSLAKADYAKAADDFGCVCDGVVPCLAHYVALEPGARRTARERVGLLAPARRPDGMTAQAVDRRLARTRREAAA
jgi:hypothetical protein